MAMVRPRCIPPCVLGVAGAAALTVSFVCSAQEIDNRPIYYVMLKSLESGFKTYNDELVSELEARLAEIRAEYASERGEIAAAVDKLEAEREQRVSVFSAERDVLNERIEDLDRQIGLHGGRASESRRIDGRYLNDHQVKSLMDGVARERAALAALAERYRTELEAARRARAELTQRFEEYMSAGDPLALEIRSLEQDWQRFSENERNKLKKLADTYADDYAAYNDWLENEKQLLDELGAALSGAVETDREQRALHARLEAELRDRIEKYNALVEVHNAAGSEDPGRDERAALFAAMEKEIGTIQADLARARETVVKVDEKFRVMNREYADRYEEFLREKRDRESRLAGNLAEINAARVAVEADIEARRQKVDAQITALEAQISSELEGARESFERHTRLLARSFGSDHEGLDTAIGRFLDDGDDGLLYDADGAPRFDLSRAEVASVYASVERMLADRRRIDARIVALDKSQGASQQTSGDASPPLAALERERAALGAERQQLLEAHASFAREHQSRSVELERRLDELDARLAGTRAQLEELFTLRAEATRSEFQLVQKVLVTAIRGHSSGGAEPGEHTKLLNALREKSNREKSHRMDASPGASMNNPHALLDHIGSRLPTDVGEHSGWSAFTRDAVVGSRILDADEKAALAAAWLSRYRRQPRFASVAEALDRTGAVASGDEALSTLFLDGVIDHTTIDEQRLDNDRVGIRVGILGRVYQLEANGSLGTLPNG